MIILIFENVVMKLYRQMKRHIKSTLFVEWSILTVRAATTGINPMQVWCWVSVADDGPTSNLHWITSFDAVLFWKSPHCKKKYQRDIKRKINVWQVTKEFIEACFSFHWTTHNSSNILWYESVQVIPDFYKTRIQDEVDLFVLDSGPWRSCKYSHTRHCVLW